MTANGMAHRLERAWRRLRSAAASASGRLDGLLLVAAARSERGASVVEYALIIAVVAVGLIAVLNTFTGAVGQVFANIMTSIQGLGR